MLRFTLSASAAALVLVLSSVPARAADPTPAQIEEAKGHFQKGKELYEQGDKKGAVEEFKAAYRLSKNALLLYNVGLVYDELGEKRLAVQYYQKFIIDAPDNAKTTGNKKVARDRLKVLEPELENDDEAGGAPKGPAGGGAEQPKDGGGGAVEQPKPPARKDAVSEFTHEVLDEAPPGKPIDLTARIPDNADWHLTLYYRTQGTDNFVAVKMKPRFQELVGRVPAAAASGNAVQYYIEVKDKGGKMVAQTGNAASPNIIYLDPKARAHYYRDDSENGSGQMVGDEDAEDGGGAAKAQPENKGGGDDETKGGGALDEEDPFAVQQKQAKEQKRDHHDDGRGGGPSDTGHRIDYVKWGTTGGAVVLLGSSVAFYFTAARYANALQDERTYNCGGRTPPCAQFGDYQRGLESSGKNYELLTNITLVAGIATAGVAGYFWYKDLKKPRGHAEKKPKPASDDAPAPPVDDASREIRWGAAPLIGPGLVGGAATIEF
jgi:hypothetical protein